MTKHLFLSESLFINLKHKHISYQIVKQFVEISGTFNMEAFPSFPIRLVVLEGVNQSGLESCPPQGIKGK